MDPETSTDRRVTGMNRWIVGLTLGTWAIVLGMIAVRFVNTGSMGRTSIFVVLIGASNLLSLGSNIAHRRVVTLLLRSGAVAAIAVATYVFFRGAH